MSDNNDANSTRKIPLLYKYFRKMSYRELLSRALASVPDDIDKREGSIIFDALAPICYELANVYDDLFNLLIQTYVITGEKPYLDLRCAERGVFRQKALPAYRKIYFSKEVEPEVYKPVLDIRTRSEGVQGLLVSTTNLEKNFTFEMVSKYKTPRNKQASVMKEFEDGSYIKAEATDNYIGSKGNGLSFSIYLNEHETMYIVRTLYNKEILYEQEISVYGSFEEIMSNPAIKFEGIGFIREVETVYLENGEDKGIEKDGYYVAECSETGEKGNNFHGEVIPLENLGDAVAEMLEVINYGRDEESDDSLRKRYFDFLKKEAFGGNIAQYREWLLNVDGSTGAPANITGAQIYPIWNGGGTVKVSFVIGDKYEEPDLGFMEEVKEYLDPEIHTQEGIGISPIGHNVTVVKPERQLISFKVPIVFWEGSLPIYEGLIKEKLEEYLLNLRKRWDELNKSEGKYIVEIIHAELVSLIMKIDGIQDVKDSELMVSKDEINWINTNLRLIETKDRQELPFLGKVIVSRINIK